MDVWNCGAPRTRSWACWAACLTLAAAAGPAQALTPTPLFETLGVEQGLPSTRVYEVVEDRSGFLWVATANGLARYDGVGFEVWRRDPTSSASLPANDVQTVFVDREDRVWLGTVDGGLSMLDRQRAGFRTWRGGKDGDGLSGIDVWSIAQAPDGALWIGTFNGGLNRLDVANDRFLVLRHDPTDSGTIASDIIGNLRVDRRGRLWVGTAAGLSLIDLAADASGGTPARQYLPGEMIVSLRESEDGSIWVGLRAGAYRIDPDGVGHAVELPSPAFVEAVEHDALGRRWFATRSGLLLEHAAGQFAAFRREPGRAYTLPSNSLMDALRDREGGLWFPAYEGGLVHVKPQWPNFTLLRPTVVDGRAVDEERVRTVSRCPDGTVLANAARGTLWRVDPAGGTSVRIEPPWPQNALPRTILAVLCASDGSYWLADRQGVSRYQAATRSFRTWLNGAPDGIEAGLVDLLHEDVDGRVWASVLGSAMERLAADGSRQRHVAWDADRESREVEMLAAGPDGAPWAVGTHGVSRFDRASGQWVELADAPQGRVEAFAFGADGTLWLHSIDALAQFRVEDDRLLPLQRIDHRDGLPVARGAGLVMDRGGRLWLVAPAGLWRIDPQRRQVRGYGRADGLMAAEFGERPPVVAPDGTVFAASSLGVVAFDPMRVEDNTVQPSVVLTGLSVLRDGERVALDPAQPVMLGHTDRDLRVTLRALSLADPGANRYRFRLAGFDTEWVDNGNRGEREYSQVPDGSYMLEGEAANPSGVWATAPMAIEVTVAPPPWRSLWAYALYAAALLMVAWFVFRAWHARIARAHTLALAEERRLAAERQSQAKTDFLADVGHEIRTPMTGLLGMTELLLRSGLDPRQHEFASTVRRSGEHLLKLINDLLDLSRIEAGRFELEPQDVDLWALVDEVVDLQRALAGERGLALASNVAADAPRHVQVDATRLKEVLLNLVNNALKFTARGRVDVELRADPAQSHGVVLAVRDTGPGMGAETVGRLFARFEQGTAPRRRGSSGLGLAISRRLVELMGGRIEVDTAPGAGTTFRVHLVLPQASSTTSSPMPSIDAASGASAGLDLLVVEDDETIRTVLIGLLGGLGHRVEAGANGLDALRLLGERRFDAGVFDLDLPGVDGLRLARMVRKRPGNDARLPLVALTANASAGIEAQCREAGFDAFVRKPAGADALAAAIAHARESRSISGGSST